MRFKPAVCPEETALPAQGASFVRRASGTIASMHFHGHGEHAGHAHHGAGGPHIEAILKWSMVATLALVAAELVGGYLARSISLVSDAFHNLTDVPTLVISWLALRWAAQPPTHEKTYGYHRSGILAAFTNAVLLALVALYILFEAFERLRQPVVVATGIMLWVSVVGLAINGGITLLLVRGRRDLNLRSILIHNFGDALSNVAIIVGAVVIGRTGAQWLDPAIGMGIGAMVLWSSFGILKESAHILLEGLPRGLRLEDVVSALLEIEGVQEVHDVHIWTLGTDLHALSCHVRIPDMHMEQSERILAQILETLARRFHITHATVQFERAGLPASSTLHMPEPAK